MGEETSESQASDLVDRFWDRLLELDPIHATLVGDERFDDRLPDPSDEGVARRAEVLSAAAGEAAGIDRASLSPDARTTLDVLDAIAAEGLDDAEFRLDRLRAVSHFFGPGQLLAEIGALQRADTPERVARYVARLKGIPAYLARVGEVAVGGVAAGMTAPALMVDRLMGQVRRLLDTSVEDSPGMAPLGDAAEGRGEVAAVLRDEVWPAYGRYLATLEAYRPHARERSLGLSALDRGDEMYASRIRTQTTLPLTAREVHVMGLEELEAIQEESEAIAGRLGHPDAASALAELAATGRDTASSREELLALARRHGETSWDAAKGFFGRRPTAACEVREVEAFREADAPPAFYYPPAGDGSRPGIYYVNLGDLPQRPLHMLATISYHEANPGHHFQLSIEQEFAGRPALRRFGAAWTGTAFAEGWGLYCERLADEMGLYVDDYERLGMLGAQAWRAVRLVVDSGLHAFGWSRERAVDLALSVGLPRGTAEAEVDRYVAYPGQALAYKVGQREIERLRAEATGRPGFSLPDWHDRLLELGTLPLPAIRRELAG